MTFSKQYMKIFVKFSNKPQLQIQIITISVNMEFIAMQANIKIKTYDMTNHGLFHYDKI